MRYREGSEKGILSNVISSSRSTSRRFNMILQRPRLWLTSQTSWPSLLAQGRALLRIGAALCFAKDQVNVRSSEISLLYRQIFLFTSTEHTDVCHWVIQMEDWISLLLYGQKCSSLQVVQISVDKRSVPLENIIHLFATIGNNTEAYWNIVFTVLSEDLYVLICDFTALYVYRYLKDTVQGKKNLYLI